MNLNRRGLLLGLGGLFAAPAIVRAASLMPVKSYAVDDPLAVMLREYNKSVLARYFPGDVIVGISHLGPLVPIGIYDGRGIITSGEFDIERRAPISFLRVAP